MDLRKSIRRRSLNVAEDAQRPRMTLSPADAAERKEKRYTWAFSPVRNLDHAAPKDSRGEQDSGEARPPELARSTSSASLHAPTFMRLSGLSPEPSKRPRSTGSGSDSKFSTTKQLSSQGGTLAPILEKRHIEISTMLQARNATPKVKRWDARARSVSVWDGLHRDSELFSQRGNCSVHFYEKGQSRRGASLKIPLERIYSARFASLFILVEIDFAREEIHHDRMHRQCDLYIPAPVESSRKDAFTWHLTTRNFFGFLLGRPVVGISLGQALIDLRERLNVFRPNDPRNHDDFMVYLERLGYLDIAHCPGYALAMLKFAEHYKLRELWVDAFVHSVGMERILNRTEEYQQVSRVTQALLTRAYLEMDLHLGRVRRALSNFFEEDFSPSNFGVSVGARAHLDRFRSFLHEFYVEKFGYWPPPKGSRFSRSVYKAMYFDFRGVFDYLVDLESTDSLVDQKPASGGICVLQNVKAFDKRNKYLPLPHPHPLLPQEVPALQRPVSLQGSLRRTFTLGTKSESSAELKNVRDCLEAAANGIEDSTPNTALVRAYQRFERDYMQKPDEKVSVSDARKVRWLLVYGALQMLISAIRAPKEVRMTETDYPLCCLVTNTSPWEAGIKVLNSRHTPSVMPPKHLDVASTTSLHPDCEADDYINSKASSVTSETPRSARRLSSLSMMSNASTKAPSRVGIIRSASIRSVKTLSSSINSITSRRPLSRRNSTGPAPVEEPSPLPRAPQPTTGKPRPTANFSEILVHAYGNGLNESVHEVLPRVMPVELSADSLPEIVVSPQSPPPSPPWKEKRFENQPPESQTSSMINEQSGSSESHASTSISCAPKSSAPEPSTAPAVDGFGGSLPGLEELSDTPSTRSSTSGPPLNPIWTSSRSNSPQSSISSQAMTEAVENENKDKLFHNEPSPISPTLLDASFAIRFADHAQPSAVSSALASRNSMDLPMVVDLEEMSVYQPLGVPSVGGSEAGDKDDDEEFPDREASKRWSVASKTRMPIASVSAPLKSSLRRTRTATSQVAKKRSVRIKEEPFDWTQRFRSNGAVAG